MASDDESAIKGINHWKSPLVQKDYAISGGLLSRPHHVDTLVRESDVFVAVRRYEVWVSQMVLGKSRRDDPLKHNSIWKTMVDAAEGLSTTGASTPALAGEDPMAEILADLDDGKKTQDKQTSGYSR